MQKLELTYLGTFWGKSGDLFYMSKGDEQARVAVDSIGHTWVDIRRIPEGGAAAGHYFHTERVEAWREYNGAANAEKILREKGFDNKRIADFAHRVEERDL